MATKKRGHGEGMAPRLRVDGRWEARVDIGRDPISGKRRRKSVFGKTRREVSEQLKTLLADQQKGLPIPTNGHQSVRQFLEQWLEDVARPNLRASTLATYESHIRKHIAPALGYIPLQQLEPQQVQTFLSQKLASGLAPRTVADIRAVLRVGLGQAFRWGLVARNVATLVNGPRIPRRQLNYLTPEQARQFLEALQSDRLEALYVTAISLGLRRGEVLAVKWEYLDLDRGTLITKDSLQRVGGKLQMVELKTHSAYRSINLPSVMVAALRQHRARQLAEKRAAGQRWKETGLVFTTRIGTAIEPRNYKRSFDCALKKAGLGHMRIHDMRHTTASLLLSQGVSMKMISEILGHARTGITQDVYSHLYEPMRQDAANKMDSLLRNIPEP